MAVVQLDARERLRGVGVAGRTAGVLSTDVTLEPTRASDRMLDQAGSQLDAGDDKR